MRRVLLSCSLLGLLGCPSPAPQTSADPTPDPDAFNETGEWGALAAPGRYRASGQAGGPRDAAQEYGGDCVGWIDTTPDHQLNVDGTRRVTLSVDVDDALGKDVTLVVVGPDGQAHCNDDRTEDDVDPKLELELGHGDYAVYIGCYSDADRLAPYTISAVSSGTAETTGATDGAGVPESAATP